MKTEKITLLLVVKNELTGNEHKRNESLLKVFDRTITVTKSSVEHRFKVTENIAFEEEQGLVAALNDACRLVETDWILLLEADEMLTGGELEKLKPRSGECFAAYITGHSGQKHRWSYDMRLLPLCGSKEPVFRGTVMPDLSEYLISRKLDISRKTLNIRKDGVVIDLDKLKLVTGLENSNSPMAWYWRGVSHSEKQHFSAAEKCFRFALKNDRLLIFYRLSALNGLANALLELNKMDNALEVANHSALINDRQYAPYLISHKIYWMRAEWQNAYNVLRTYLKRLNHRSQANLDFVLDPGEAHYLLAEISQMTRNSAQVYYHLEKFYQLKDGLVSSDVKDKLYVYAVELEEKEKAIEFLEVLFAEQISGQEEPDKHQIKRILGAISLLEVKGWNQAACQMYEKLFCMNSDNQKIMRRWLISLMKSNQLERAKKVAKILGDEMPATRPLTEIQFS